jgi:hypothetical protein
MKLLAAVLLGAICAAGAAAGELPAAGGEFPAGAIKIGGRIQATGGNRLAPAAAKLTAADGKVYNLVLDVKGRSLVGVMHGEQAEVVGIVSQKDSAAWLQVLGYTDERVTEAHELWRRMRCNACVVLPATVNAAAPGDLHGAAPVTGRYYTSRERFTAWARDAQDLWLAADNQLVQINLAKGEVARRWGRKDGLPDQLVYQLLSDGRDLWIVYRGGVAARHAGADSICDLPKLGCHYARVFADAGGVWVIADSGTFRLKDPGAAPEVLPALPTAARIAKVVTDGIWIPHWERRTGHFVSSPASIAGRLYAGSYGDIYELSDGKWGKVATGWEQAARNGRLWFLSSKGLNEYDPATRENTTHEPPEACRGRYARLLLADSAAWVAAEPLEDAGGRPQAGGLARFDFGKRQWQSWARIGEAKTNRVSCLTAAEGSVWALLLDGNYSVKSAHPGMTTTRKSIFVTTGMSLHRFDAAADKWQSWPLELSEVEKRLICGQDGSRGMDALVPEFVEELCVGPDRAFAAMRLAPKQYFGGYWPCVSQVASRAAPGGAWSAKLIQHPAELGLQGEQPLVLNISNGELTRVGSTLKDQLWEAVAHDLVLGLFVHGGRHWAVTEGGAAWSDSAAADWRRVVEPQYRYYWRATAALEDGKYLYLGSDRGLVARLDTETGLFEPLTALRERTVTRIAKGKDGDILIASQPAPLGVLPVFLAGKLNALDCDAARFDGKVWTPAKMEDLPPPGADPRWVFRNFGRKGHYDKSQGNWLCEQVPDEAEPKPRYYVEEVFYPLWLCGSADGRRMWLSTYTGLLRLDLEKEAPRGD